MTRSTSLLVTVLSLTALAGTTLAQAQPKATEPTLKGPAVKEGGVPGENRQFGDGKVKGKERMGSEIPHRLFMNALDSLRGDTSAVRLTDAQDSKIKAINEAFLGSVATYRQARESEARELIQQLPQEERRKAAEFLRGGGFEGKRPAAALGNKAKKGKAPEAKPDEMTGEVDAKKAEDAKAKLRELLEAAPKPADTHTQIFAVLTDSQKPVFQKELDRLRKEMQDKAYEKKTDRKAAQKDAPAAGKDVDLNDPRIPEQMRERLKNMTPEERQQALEKLRTRLQRGGKAGAPGGAKPAPSTDKDVNIPAPDKK